MAIPDDPIEKLHWEHRLLLAQLQALADEIDYFAARPTAMVRERQDAIAGLLQVLVRDLEAHGRREDGALFPVLREAVTFCTVAVSIPPISEARPPKIGRHSREIRYL